jgi:uncharacterized protein (TIGR00297 family)
VVALGGIVLVVAGRLRWLTPSGQLAAAVVGLAVLLGSGMLGVALLFVFFLSSSVLSRFRAERKGRAGEPGGRSAMQVVANGGVAAGFSLLALAGWVPAAHYALIGALAAATADTWATEIGTAGRWPTWSVIGRGRVASGDSGGVSIPGTLGGIAGAALIGVAAALIARSGAGVDDWVRMGILAGTGGMFVDSILGATLEDRLDFIGNDEVNLGCTLVGSAVALALHAVLP